MVKLVSFELSQEGRDMCVFHAAANTLQIGDELRQLFRRCIRCRLRGIIEFAHQIIESLYGGRQVLRGTGIVGCRTRDRNLGLSGDWLMTTSRGDQKKE